MRWQHIECRRDAGPVDAGRQHTERHQEDELGACHLLCLFSQGAVRLSTCRLSCPLPCLPSSQPVMPLSLLPIGHCGAVEACGVYLLRVQTDCVPEGKHCAHKAGLFRFEGHACSDKQDIRDMREGYLQSVRILHKHAGPEVV